MAFRFSPLLVQSAFDRLILLRARYSPLLNLKQLSRILVQRLTILDQILITYPLAGIL